MGDLHQDDDRVRRRRNLAIAAVLAGLALLFFVMTMVRIQGFYG
jgi:hypothetical protein